MKLEEIKNFLRIDGDDDDEFLLLLMDAAKEYVTHGIGRCDESSARVKLVLLTIVSTLYENRLFTVESANEKVQYAIRSMMMQLSLECGEGDDHGDEGESGGTEQEDPDCGEDAAQTE